MTTLQRRLFFWLGLFAVYALLFIFVPWKAIPMLLFLLGILFSGPLTTLYEYVLSRPVHTPEYQSSSQPQEAYPPYTEGLQEVPSYQPPVSKEEPAIEDAPQAQYPQQQYR